MTAMTYPAHLQPTRSISRTQVWLLRVFGPAESWDNPLFGTKYDPRLAEHRQREAVAHRRARAAARALGTQSAARANHAALTPAVVS